MPCKKVGRRCLLTTILLLNPESPRLNLPQSHLVNLQLLFQTKVTAYSASLIIGVLEFNAIVASFAALGSKLLFELEPREAL